MARPPRPLDPARADRLLNAAAEAFVVHGWEASSINAILAAAGMGKSSFYHYFDTKQSLHDWVVATLAERMAEGAEVPDLASLDADSFWPAMERFLDSLVRSAGRRPETAMLGRLFHFSGSPGPRSRLDRLREEVSAWITECVRTGQRIGAVRDDLPTELLVALSVATLTAIDRWILAGDDPAKEGQVMVGRIVELIGDQLSPRLT